MLIGCRKGCKKRVETTAKLDPISDEAICDFCEEIIPVSKFTKNLLKNNKLIINKDKNKPFRYKCETCKTIVSAEIKNDKMCGEGCQKDCKFNVSVFVRNSLLYKVKDEVENE